MSVSVEMREAGRSLRQGANGFPVLRRRRQKKMRPAIRARPRRPNTTPRAMGVALDFLLVGAGVESAVEDA